MHNPSSSRTRPLPSLLSFMSLPLPAVQEQDSHTAGIPRRTLRNAHAVNDSDDHIASVHHDLFQRATPVQNDSPLRRAGLLQPQSHASSFNSRQLVVPHSQDDIRLNTVQLSNLLMAPPVVERPRESPGQTLEQDSFIFSVAGRTFEHSTQPTTCLPAISMSPTRSLSSSVHTTEITASTPSLEPRRSETRTPKGKSEFKPSGLSLLLARQQDESPDQDISPRLTAEAALTLPTADRDTEVAGLTPPSPASDEITPTTHQGSAPPRKSMHWEAPPRRSTTGESTSDLMETTPLLSHTTHPSYYHSRNDHPKGEPKRDRSTFGIVTDHVRTTLHPENLHRVFMTSIRSLPAVILGSLLNILDGVSYGMILFPAAGAFADLGPMGVSMFFVSTIIAQLVYTFQGSGFAGANGSMMIEVVPFFHILATSIAQLIGDDHPHEIVATTLVAYALSSFLTGFTFFLLGALKLGVIIGFFPRHILVGCIGGVGAFLIETGITVSLRIDDDDLTMTWETFKFVFLDSHSLALWGIPLGLAVLLRVITHRCHHQLIFPLYFIVIPLVFYLVVLVAGWDLGRLREAGWVFDMGSREEEAWYKFYTLYDLGAVKWTAIWTTLPTQFALLFFNILHPPLNVPALAVSLNEDIDTDKELVAHGLSNFLAGAFGTVPNYLVYVNTLLFYRVGGNTRIAGFLLAVATALLLFIGTRPIAYLPVMVVGSLIFVLGIDLVKEALWDTRHRVSRMEYITIASIMVCMTVWDFVIGVLFGIVISSFFFVIQNSQQKSIRAFHTGETAISTVRRPSSQRAYIREVSKQTTILRLQGFLFFGTIASVERAIRDAIEGPSWHHNPIRFLVLDLSLVAGVDMSAAEAFVRVHRLLNAKCVALVFCGFSEKSAIGQALQSVGVLGGDKVELFSTFDEAMEWTENAYLRAWFRSQKAEVKQVVALPGRQDADIVFERSLASSPRRSHLDDAGQRTIAHESRRHVAPGDNAEPYNTLAKVFSCFGEATSQQFQALARYLERVSAPEGLVLWQQNDPSDGLYIIESGILRAIYKFSDHTPIIEESMVPGTLAGELSALSSLSRNATVVVERQAVLWKLSIQNLRKLETDDPVLARTFMQLVLKAAKIDNDTLLSALATRQ